MSMKSSSASVSGESDEETVPSSSAKFRSLPASERKLDYDSSSEDEAGGNDGFRFIDLCILSSIFETLNCPECKSGYIIVKEEMDSKMGLASLLSLECSALKCTYSKRFYTSGKVNNKSKAFEVNRRVVLATRNIGVGHQGLVKFCAAMNMLPPMNENAYRDHVKAIHDAADVIANISMCNAAEETKHFYEAEDDGMYDIGISADGTWRRRGFSSSCGVVTAISLITGKVLDVEVMSKECKECMGWKGKEETAGFEHWWEGHQHKCHANFEGSSGAMDAAGCVAMFQRSVARFSLRYVEFLGDGDSKAFNLLVEICVYGDILVNKLECVGHVQKRMGSRLRSLKKRLGKTRLNDGKSVGGRGRLTDKVIDKLQVYFGKAIRDNTHSTEDMKNAVLAIWHHTKSTDDEPNHNLCPEGEHSWCGFQRDLANNTSEYTHKHPLPQAIADSIWPVFEALSANELLSSCLHGGTQNQNEAFNALIWQRATKETHSSLPTVELATFLAVGHFNDGATTIVSILDQLEIDAGSNCRKACKKLDFDRLRHSCRKSSPASKERRKKIRHRKKGYIDTLEEREDPQYEAGAF